MLNLDFLSVIILTGYVVVDNSNMIPRPGYPINQDDIEQLQTLGGDCLIADVFAPAVSSTDYREKGDKQAVPAPIKDYIEGQKLYP